MNLPYVVIKDVSKSFSKDQPLAIDNISLHLEKGQITAIAGPDGSGKSTLIRMMAGLLKPTSGNISILGHDTIEDAKKIYPLIGYMPQKFGLYEDLTVIQNLNLFADLKSCIGKEREEAYEKLLQFTDLKSFQNRLVHALSGGMKQKLGLACALIGKPKLLLLDEPSVGVDPISRRELWKMVAKLIEEDIAVVWSTSYLNEVERAHTALLLYEGKLKFHGTPNELARQGKNTNNKSSNIENAFIEILDPKMRENERSLLAEKTPQITSTRSDAIKAISLTKKYGSFTAVDNISFEVATGEIFGLLGPKGAGKSTTFKMLCGLLKPTTGNALVDGLDLQTASGFARSQIGYMAQKFSLYSNLSVSQNLDFFSGIYDLKRKDKQNTIQEMIDIFSLKPYLSQNADSLPLGIKQRLSLSCVSLHKPKILFLDEPTSGVDPITRREFWNHIKGIAKKGITIMVTTHFMDEAENCDRIALVYKAKIINMGTPEELKLKAASKDNLSPTLEDAFIELITLYDGTSR